MIANAALFSVLFMAATAFAEPTGKFASAIPKDAVPGKSVRPITKRGKYTTTMTWYSDTNCQDEMGGFSGEQTNAFIAQNFVTIRSDGTEGPIHIGSYKINECGEQTDSIDFDTIVDWSVSVCPNTRDWNPPHAGAYDPQACNVIDRDVGSFTLNVQQGCNSAGIGYYGH